MKQFDCLMNGRTNFPGVKLNFVTSVTGRKKTFVIPGELHFLAIKFL
jgi:hypothetical protein